MGSRDKAAELDFSAILEEEVEQKVKDAAVVSMGTEMSPEDLLHVSSLCDQVIELTEYRTQLYSYLKNRMQVRVAMILHGSMPTARRECMFGTGFRRICAIFVLYYFAPPQ